MALALRRAASRKVATPRAPTRAQFMDAQLKRLLAASDQATKLLQSSTMPTQQLGAVPQFARGGSVDHGAMSPDAQARAMLRDEGVEHPSASALNHLSRAISTSQDPAKIAHALAQASHAGRNGYALDPLSATHHLNRAMAQRGAPQVDSVTAAFAAMAQRGRFDDGGSVDAGVFDTGFGSVPASALTDTGAAPAPTPPAASVPFWGSAPSALPSAQQAAQTGNRTTMLQNGFDASAVTRFWGGNVGDNGTPLATMETVQPHHAPGAMGGAGYAIPSAPQVPLYNPMSDPAVRNSLHLARGGVALDPVTMAFAAMDRRPHFEDGGGEGGGDSGGDGGSDNGSSSSSSSGGYGGVGGFGGNPGGNDGYGGSSTSSSSSGSSGGVGGFGGMSGGSDGYGGGNSVSSSSSGGYGGHSDASTSGGYGGSSSSGGYGGGSSSGSDSGGFGGVGGSVGGASASSGDVGSIGGSVGAPAAGGFSTSGNDTGGFGSFGATPTAKSNPAGLSGGLGSASSISGQTAGQSASSEAASGGDPGEDGTTSAGSSPTTGQAFASFGPAPSSPFGSMANVENSFGTPGAAAAMASVPSSVAATDVSGAADLSRNAAMFSSMGMNGVDPSLAGGLQSAMQANAMPAAGLSIANPNGNMPGFDNFGATGGVQQSSLGPDGFRGADLGSLSPTDSYAAPGGTLNGAMVGALQGGLPSAVDAAMAAAQPSVSPAFGEPGLPDYGKPFAPDMARQNAIEANGITVGGLKHIASDLGFGPTNSTGPTPGLNADGDPVSVDGTPALTIHGPAVEAATGGYDVPAGMQNDQDVTNYANAQMAKTIAAKYGMNLSDAAAAGFIGNAMREGPMSLPGGVTGIDPGAIGVGDVRPGVNSVGVNQDNRARAAGMFSNMVTGTNGAAEDPGNFAIAQTATSVSDPAAVAAAAAAMRAVPGALPSQIGYSLGEISTQSGFKSVKDTLNDPNSTPAQIAAAMQQFEGSKNVARDVGTNLANAQGVQASIDAIGGLSGVAPSVAQTNSPSYTAGFGVGAGIAPNTFSPSGVSFSAPGEAGASDAPAFAPTPAAPAQQAAQTVSTPSAYAGTDDEGFALDGMGYAATPARALTIHAFGMQDPNNPESPLNAAANVIGLPAGTPIDGVTEYIDSNEGPAVHRQDVPVISPAARAAAEAQYPGLFNGVQTVGDLRSNIATIAATAGPPTTSTVTTPASTPAPDTPTPSKLTISPAAQPAWGRIGDYTGDDGRSPGYGLGTISAGVPTTINNAGTLGVPTGVGVTQAEQNLAGWSQVSDPSVPTFARNAIKAPGFSPSTGFSDAPATPAAPTTPATTPSTTASDVPAPEHLSVNPKVANAAVNAGMTVLGGPFGGVLAGVNTLSSLFGGPTIGDGINAILANNKGGTPDAPGGRGGNSSAGYMYRAGSDFYVPATAPAPSTDGTASDGALSAAQQAYLAFLANNPSTSDSSITPQHTQYRVPSAGQGNLYNPMLDPAVMRALAAMQG